MGKSNIIYYLLACLFLEWRVYPKEATNHHSQHKTNWQTVLQDKLPLLGHRNWIVITDMAYPLQNQGRYHHFICKRALYGSFGHSKKMVDNSLHVCPYLSGRRTIFSGRRFCQG